MKSILIFGAGGHAKVVCDILEVSGEYKIAGFVDGHFKGSEFLGYPILSKSDDVSKLEMKAGIIAVGDGYLRAKIAQEVKKYVPNFTFVSAIHPSAQIAKSASIGDGSVVMANGVVNPGARLGAHTLVNTAASVDHDCVLEDFAGIGPGVRLGGNVHLGRASYVGIGATLIQGIKVGKESIVGAGSVVVKNLEGESIYFGSPAKFVEKRDFSKRYF